jgi:hypothetical protein
MRTNGHTDTAKLIVAFASFANAPKNRARIKPKIQNKNEALQFTDDNNNNYYYCCCCYYYYYYYYYCIFIGIPNPLHSYFYFLLLLFFP